MQLFVGWIKHPLEASNKYYVKHGVNDVQAKIMYHYHPL